MGLRVGEVLEGSPAFIAGLKSSEDYILGTKKTTFVTAQEFCD